MKYAFFKKMLRNPNIYWGAHEEAVPLNQCTVQLFGQKMFNKLGLKTCIEIIAAETIYFSTHICNFFLFVCL